MSEPPKPETDPATASAVLARQGVTLTFESDAQRREALNQAFDYRGDVTLETDGGEVVEGYVFDRRGDEPEPYVRVLTPDGRRASIPYARIAKLAFTGRDTAAGKSWETWVRKYVEKKRAGLEASIEPEKLD